MIELELSPHRVVESLERAPSNEAAIVPKLMASYTAARSRVPQLPPEYLPAPGWGNLLDAEWARWREAISQGDVSVVTHLLRNFFRNEGISGFWGSDRMFEGFRDEPNPENSWRDGMILKQYKAWREGLPDVPLAELVAPLIGNPWGYSFDGHLVYEPAFEYHYQADHFHRLIGELRAPVILEIGGGFGGLGYHILRRTPGVTYLGLDLPENVMIQAYYLASSFPEARILVYDGSDRPLGRELIDAYDAILMPNFMLPQVESSAADLVVNSRSLSEMSAGTVAEYLRQIDRIGQCWFWHENLDKGRSDGHPCVPSVAFPPLVNFTRVADSESRWPRYCSTSPYACREKLYFRRDRVAVGRRGMKLSARALRKVRHILGLAGRLAPGVHGTRAA